jgi:hypothetical protein
VNATRTTHYTVSAADAVLTCRHQDSAPSLGLSAPAEESLWIRFLLEHIPALREYVAALAIYAESVKGGAQ